VVGTLMTLELIFRPVSSSWQRRGGFSGSVEYEHVYACVNPTTLTDRNSYEGTITVHSPDPVDPNKRLRVTLHLEDD
jgi:hypothetical protein